ncbi:hypothetical protein [Paenibacillus oleatilyticus]|uniref:Uncharacterized protein n=1 Tax=Paenibacillus oleatilyticus TaxID=2594886 RepID=A0ABV4V9E0_9BACL
MDFTKKNNWTVEMLEKPLVLHTVLRPEERGNFDLLWVAKLDCEKTVGGIIYPESN